MNHPQHRVDLLTLQNLPDQEPTPVALGDLARLYIRYLDFQGSDDIHARIKQLLKAWGLTPDILFQRTRALHQQGGVFQGDSNRQDDWA